MIFENSLVTETPTIIAKSNKGETMLALEFSDSPSDEESERKFSLNEDVGPSEQVKPEVDEKEVKCKFKISESSKKLLDQVRSFNRSSLKDFFDESKGKVGIDQDI